MGSKRSGGSTEVKVDGKDLAGLDLNSVTCVKQAGKITVASGAIGGQQGLGIVISPETRQRVRNFARARLAAPAGNAFLAEILAAESDY